MCDKDASRLCLFICRFISLFGLLTFFFPQKLFEETESMSSLLQHLHSLFLLLFKYCNELLWQNDILDIYGFCEQRGNLIFCVTGNTATQTCH